MAGFVLDIYVEFFFRIALRMVNEARSRHWPVATARVTGCDFQRAGYGCNVAVVRYEYLIEGDSYDGVYKEPFLVKTLGEEYPRRFQAGVDYPVRVKPSDPLTSVPIRT